MKPVRIFIGTLSGISCMLIFIPLNTVRCVKSK